MVRNERAYNLAQDWVKWLDTRRFYGQPEQKNILARLIKERDTEKLARPTGFEPDGSNSADLQAFNIAVTSLPAVEFIPFIVVYCEFRPKPIKILAHEQGINASNFYQRAHRVASGVLSITDKLMMLNQQLQRDIC